MFSSLIEDVYNVSVYNPFQIKAFRGAFHNRKQKNDVIDAVIIANYLKTFGSENTTLPNDYLLSLKQLINQIVAFAGIDPSSNQSGNSASVNEKTSKRGSPYLRHALFTATFVAMNNDKHLCDFYDRKKAEGKHHFVAMAGVQRKLLGIIWFVLKEQRPYIPYN